MLGILVRGGRRVLESLPRRKLSGLFHPPSDKAKNQGEIGYKCLEPCCSEATKKNGAPKRPVFMMRNDQKECRMPSWNAVASSPAPVVQPVVYPAEDRLMRDWSLFFIIAATP